MFQIGRLGSNDFVVKGPLHYDDSMITCGPLSRYACRIEVSRKAPFTAEIFAAGFSESKVLFIHSFSGYHSNRLGWYYQIWHIMQLN